jgi:hypothetical protein
MPNVCVGKPNMQDMQNGAYPEDKKNSVAEYPVTFLVMPTMRRVPHPHRKSYETSVDDPGDQGSSHMTGCDGIWRQGALMTGPSHLLTRQCFNAKMWNTV